MKTFFYNRTAYQLANIPVPSCFIQLDEAFEKQDIQFLGTNYLIANNLCRRMANIDFYSQQIEESLKRPNKWQECELIGVLLISYFGSCKSLLDAIAITLNQIYKLELSNRQQDFSKPSFWTKLAEVQPLVKERYSVYVSLSNEIILWRDASIHRVTPLVMVQGTKDPGEMPLEDMDISLLNDRSADIYLLIKEKRKPKWISPLYYHKKWRPELLKICSDLCEDIQNNPIEDDRKLNFN